MPTFYSNDDLRAFEQIETIAAARTLTPADSGKVFYLKAATGAAIALPAVATAAGVVYEFITGQLFATTAWTVVAATAVIQGSVEVAGAVVVANNESLITFAHAADAIGDHVIIKSDGTNWVVRGAAALSGGITLTAP